MGAPACQSIATQHPPRRVPSPRRASAAVVARRAATPPDPSSPESPAGKRGRHRSSCRQALSSPRRSIYSSSEGYGSNGSKVLERTDADLNCISAEMLTVPLRLHPTVRTSTLPESDVALVCMIRLASIFSKARSRLVW
jgi:hypothetical protein